MIPDPAKYETDRFLLPEEFAEMCRASGLGKHVSKIAQSEEGRPIEAGLFGHGPLRASLMAGAHADEPVGPETLRRLVLEMARDPESFRDAFERFTFHIIPHVNPDGEARNADWRIDWPDPSMYLLKAVREQPGRDVEFGYPNLRPENEAAAAFWRGAAPFHLHVNLHGMGFSDGAMLLIERHWAGRSAELRAGFAAAVAREGLLLHDHNRKGEKGFFQIEPGFTTTPEGAMMRAHFLGQNDPRQASLFRESSMEYIRSLGGDPLCLVTELPLFLVDGDRTPGEPTAYLAWRRALPDLQRRLATGEPGFSVLGGAPIRPLDIETAIRLQREAIRLGLQACSEDGVQKSP